MQLTATHCNTLQHTGRHLGSGFILSPRHSDSTHGNTLQHTAPHCNTLQRGLSCFLSQSVTTHKVTHCNTLNNTATHFNTLQHTATSRGLGVYCLTPVATQTVIHCNTLQFSISCLALSPSKRAHVCCFSSLPLATPFFLSTYMYVCICVHIWMHMHVYSSFLLSLFLS